MKKRITGRKKLYVVLITGLLVGCAGLYKNQNLTFSPDRQSPAAANVSERKSNKDAVGQETEGYVGGTLDMGKIPPFDGNPCVEVNRNVPFFTQEEFTSNVFETYSDLDSLGRCGVAYANICKELMPTEERGKIGMIKPAGWHTIKYDSVDGKYLYNRCHLIGFQLAGENANKKNLITGTRYLNVEGMLPFENEVADYVKDTGNHVLYRVTPEYTGNNLLANGVLMEAASIEDTGIHFCVFIYNSQPGIVINYFDGSSKKERT